MDKYGLIGYPLGHSFSISYFNQRFQDEGINAVYENFEIPTIEALDEVLNLNPELKGLNVTIPYKEKVIPYLDSISPEARAIGAVNVIKVSHEGKSVKLKGYNSDVIGFTKSIEPMIEKKWHKKALILGTGGASKAINYGLRNLGLETVFVSRYERPDIKISLPISYANIMSLSTVPLWVCIPRPKNAHNYLTRQWTRIPSSTISFIILTRHSS